MSILRTLSSPNYNFLKHLKTSSFQTVPEMHKRTVLLGKFYTQKSRKLLKSS